MSFPPGLLDEEKYEVLHKLGEGGMGTVWKVRHVLLEDERVVKVIRRHPAEDPTSVERFHHEARTAIRLRHPGIAQLYDFSVAPDGTAVIVMELIDGVTVLEFFKSHGKPELGLTVEIALQGLDALGYLHEMGYVHRDISPDNLMLTRGRGGRPAVKLIDLGLAKNLQSSLKLTETGTYLGKVRYSAPEQFGDAGVDARSDVYSFGVMLYELLTGVLPISGEQFSELVGGHLVRPPRAFSETDPEGRVPADLRAVVLKTLEKDPAERFSSAAELARSLQPFQLPYHSPFSDDGEIVTPSGAAAAPAALATRAVDERMQTAVTVRTGQPVVRRERTTVDRPRSLRWAKVLSGLAVAAALAAGIVAFLRPPAEVAPYRQGLAELKEERWLAARQSLEAAAEIEGQERKEIEDGMLDPYLPHYFLGVTHFRLRNYERAWKEWETSEQQGVIRDTSQYSELVELRREIVPAAIDQAKAQLRMAQEHAANVEPFARGGDQEFLRTNAPELADEARRLLDRFDEVTGTLASAERTESYIAVSEVEVEIRDVGDKLLKLSEQILDLLSSVDPP